MGVTSDEVIIIDAWAPIAQAPLVPLEAIVNSFLKLGLDSPLESTTCS